MTDINLIPWRHIKREREKRAFMMISVFILFALASLFLMKHGKMKTMIKNKKDANYLLQEKLIQKDKKINELALINQRKDLTLANIEKINNSKEEMVITLCFLDEIKKIIPEDVYLEEIQIKEKKVVLTGYSILNRSISGLIKSLNKSLVVKKAALMHVIKNEDGSLSYKNEFKLSVLLDDKSKDCWRNESKSI